MPGVRPADVSLVLVKHVQGDVNWRPAGEVLSVALENDEICWSKDKVTTDYLDSNEALRLLLDIQCVLVTDDVLIFKVEAAFTSHSLLPGLGRGSREGFGWRVGDTPTFLWRTAFSFHFVSFRINRELLLIFLYFLYG